MPERSHSNRRRFVRVSPQSGHPIRIDINGENFLDILYANEISVGGVGISVPHLFEGCDVDSAVSLIIGLPYPEDALISVTGQIKHVSGDRFGVSFSHLSRQQKSKIRAYIAARLKPDSLIEWLKFNLRISS